LVEHGFELDIHSGSVYYAALMAKRKSSPDAASITPASKWVDAPADPSKETDRERYMSTDEYNAMDQRVQELMEIRYPKGCKFPMNVCWQQAFAELVCGSLKPLKVQNSIPQSSNIPKKTRKRK
jgi:hypothetical protein